MKAEPCRSRSARPSAPRRRRGCGSRCRPGSSPWRSARVSFLLSGFVRGVFGLARGSGEVRRPRPARRRCRRRDGPTLDDDRLLPAFKPERISTTPSPSAGRCRWGAGGPCPPPPRRRRSPRSLACTAPSGTTSAFLRDSPARVTSAKNPGLSTPGFFTQASDLDLSGRGIRDLAHVVDAGGERPACPSAATRNSDPRPCRARSDSRSDTLKRRRSRLVSTRVASTSPSFTYRPVSTVRVLITPPRGGRTSERLRFWRAMSRSARRRRPGPRAARPAGANGSALRPPRDAPRPASRGV